MSPVKPGHVACNQFCRDLQYKIFVMEYTIAPQGNAIQQTLPQAKTSWFKSFVNWTDYQEANYHIAWTGASIISMAAVIFPVTLAIVLMNGALFSLILATMISLVLVITLNLAAQSTRYTIPAFILAVLINIATVVISFMV